MKQTLLLLLVVAALMLFSCAKKQEETPQVDVTVENNEIQQTTEQAQPAAEISKWDAFLDEFERTVIMWEKKTADYKLSVSDIAALTSQQIELVKKANDAEFKKTGTPGQLQRAADLTARISKLTAK